LGLRSNGSLKFSLLEMNGKGVTAQGGGGRNCPSASISQKRYFSKEVSGAQKKANEKRMQGNLSHGDLRAYRGGKKRGNGDEKKVCQRALRGKELCEKERDAVKRPSPGRKDGG